MRQILACAGVNGNEKAFGKLLEVAGNRKPDSILFAGGIVAPLSGRAGKVDFVTRFFESLGKLGCFAAVIPGPDDTPLREFLRAGLNAEVVYPRLMVAHATPVIMDETVVTGLGGLLTESEDSYEPVTKHSHASAEYYLRALWRAEKPIKVLLLAEAPTGRLGASNGSAMAHELIKGYPATICVVRGKRKDRGSEQIGKTLVVNPGQVAEGSAAWIDRVAQRADMIDL